MLKLLKPLLTLVFILLSAYLLLCLLLYFQQEKLIFFPRKLPKEYRFHFEETFEERYIPAADGTLLHGVLFKADTVNRPSKGLIFFLHGNAGALDSWGMLADTYTGLQYDVFMLDYRGYGKSGGQIESQQQLFSDVQTAYTHLAADYREEDIIITGFSIGTGPAAMLAAYNNPQKLLLLAPYYSLVDMMQQRFSFIPPFLLKYPFKTWAFLERTKAPAYLFHGTADEVIPYQSSIKLKKHLKADDRYFSLEGQDHNGIHGNPLFQAQLSKLLQSNERFRKGW